MRGLAVAVLATLIVAAPAAAQKVNHHSALMKHDREALAMARKLENAKTLRPATLKRDVTALGKHLDGADAELSELDKTVTGSDKTTLESVETHQKEARTHYDELVKVENDPSAVETHAKAVVEHLTAAENVHAQHGGMKMSKEKGKG